MSVKNDVKKSINFRIASALFLTLVLVTSLGIYGKYVYDTGNIEFRVGGVLADTANQFYKVVIRVQFEGGRQDNYTLTQSSPSCQIPLGAQILEIIPFINISTAYVPSTASYPGEFVEFSMSFSYNGSVITTQTLNVYGTYNQDTQLWESYAHGWLFYTLQNTGVYTVEITAYTK